MQILNLRGNPRKDNDKKREMSLGSVKGSFIELVTAVGNCGSLPLENSRGESRTSITVHGTERLRKVVCLYIKSEPHVPRKSMQ